MTEGTEHGIEVVVGGLLFFLGLALLLQLCDSLGEQVLLWRRLGAGFGTEAQMGELLWRP